MTTFLFTLAIYAQGLVSCLLLRRHVGALFCGWAAFPLGMLQWVSLVLVLLLSPVPWSPALLFAAWGALFFCTLVLVVREAKRGASWGRDEMLGLAAQSVFFAIAAALLCRFNLAVLTVDSFIFIDIGRSLMHFGDVQPGVELGSRGIFPAISQGSGVLLGVGYLPEIPPLMAISFAGAFVQLGARGLEGAGRTSGRGIALASLVVLAMFSPYTMILHIFYIHGNLSAAIYLSLFAFCFWTAEESDDSAWLSLAFVFLFGFVLQRIEATGISIVFLVLAWSRSRFSARRLLPRVALFALALELWLWTLQVHAGPDSRIMTPGWALVMMGGTAAVVPMLLLFEQPALRRIRRAIPAIVFAVSVAGFAFALDRRPNNMADSLSSLWGNASGLAWGGLWPAILVLAVGALWLPKIPGNRIFSCGAAFYLVAIVLLSLFRTPYRPLWQDSGNRMLIHVLPLLMFWLMLSYGRPLLVRLRRATGSKLEADTAER